MKIRATLAMAAVVLALVTGACKPDLIPGTNVEDTSENRQVIEFLGKYRNAMVERSAEGVLGLCAMDYFEDRGTVDQSDDYGRDALRTRLTDDFGRMKELQLEIIVQKITPPDDKLPADKRVYKVAYRYNTRALVSFPAGEKWISVSDVNQMTLRPDDAGGFLIVSGL